jgi:hypothetical protein
MKTADGHDYPSDGSPDAPAKHVWVRCEHPGCTAKGMWTRARDLRVLCTDHDRQALLACDARPQ